MKRQRLNVVAWMTLLLLLSHYCRGEAQSDSQSTVIMIGIDGLRPSAIDTVPAKNLRHLAKTGVRAKSLIPVMPTKTFVNFYSIATGLYPEHHGMISNAPYDRRLARTFNVSKDVRDPQWWLGEPIWISAEKQGVKTATYFWVGSEVVIDGIQPRYWKPYQQNKDYAERVNEVLAWLDLPAAQRPRLITLYFSAVDTAVHHFGVDSEGEREAILRVDQHIGRLLEGLEQRNMADSTDIIVVSDHGMADVSSERLINLDNWLDVSDWIIPEWRTSDEDVNSPFLSLFTTPANVARAYQLLKNADPHLQVYRPADYPEHYHFSHPDRIPDLMLLATPGWEIYASRDAKYQGKTPTKKIMGAAHGYDNHSPQMQATFIASGPDFIENVQVAPFENVEVYGLVACLLDIKPTKNDGDVQRVAHLLKKPCHKL
ncbi:ectonucleotide pyrophosphatase/phosphodiesterase [Paraglaciecola sp.]|uniref:alkaline phosphatase family protein n=1 Tax=Paraglaciecola sp. TaxID=1920173 RepID=UPI0030F40BD8